MAHGLRTFYIDGTLHESPPKRSPALVPLRQHRRSGGLSLAAGTAGNSIRLSPRALCF